jgi:hypothetical protein
VALSWAYTAYACLSSTRQAPEELTSLAGHVHATQKLLEAFHPTIAKPAIHTRPYNVRCASSVNEAANNLSRALHDIDTKTKGFVEKEENSRRFRWALVRGEVVELERLLVGRITSLTTVLLCLDLWVLFASPRSLLFADFKSQALERRSPERRLPGHPRASAKDNLASSKISGYDDTG